MEGVIFGILRYFCYLCDTNFLVFVAELSVHISGCEMAHLLARIPRQILFVFKLALVIHGKLTAVK